VKQPQKPSKTIIVPRSLKWNDYDGTMLLPDFLKWIEKNIPKKVQSDALVRVIMECRYGDTETYFQIFWNEKVVDPDFEKEMKKYTKNLKKWKKEQKQ
jgi:hypothetical protein